MEVLTDPNCTIPTPDPATAPGLFGPDYDYEGEDPPVEPPPPAPDRLAQARALLARSLDALYAEQTTLDERVAVARELGEPGSVDLLADLPAAEWATWCNGAAGGAIGMAARVTSLKAAVKAVREEREAEARAARTSSTPGGGVRGAIMARLSRTEEGRVKGTYANIVTIFRMDPRYETLRMSDLGDVVELAGEELAEGPATADACEWLRDSYGMDAGEVQVKTAIWAVAQGKRYSPVREYLERVRPIHRRQGSTIARILPEVLGITKANDMHRAMIKRFLIGAVARAMRPGCKMDTALVLIGGQGAKKSTFFASLFGEFFADSPIPIGSKDAAIQLSRVWGYEASELEDLTSKRTAEAVKQFMASSSDLYRPPFARAAVQVPRHTVLCGSANPRDILTDPSGSRRFWILAVPPAWVVPVAFLRSLRDAIWSEALDLYGDGSGDGETGEPWWFDRAADAVREIDARQYQIADDWQPLVERWLATPAGQFEPAPGVIESFTRSAVLSGIGLTASQIDRRASVRVAAILTRLGWDEHNSPAGFQGSRVWRRLPASEV
jgi:predicted P-loop ATPase